MTLGFHMQAAIPNWPTAVQKMPAGAVYPVVNDFFLARDIMQHSPGARPIFRKWWDNNPQWGGDYQEEKRRARLYFDSFIDGTWLNEGAWRWFWGIKELNEYQASSNPEPERQLIIIHLQAWCDVWNTEYRGTSKMGYMHTPLVCLSTPVGNDIDWRYAKIITETGNVISYHGYTHVKNGVIDPEDWRHFSGRWAFMDEEFRGRGIYPTWVGTEGGPFAGVHEGWRHPTVYDGNLNKYADEFIPYHLDRVAAWNKQHNDRFIGGSLFTVGKNDTWKWYLHDAAQMERLAEKIRDYAPSPPPPPPPVTDWMKRAWNYSVQHQIDYGIHVNPQAGLTQAIEADEMRIVDNEISFEGRVFQAAETYDGSRARRLYVYEQGKPIWWFNEPEG